jgi:hypothetical protein
VNSNRHSKSSIPSRFELGHKQSLNIHDNLSQSKLIHFRGSKCDTPTTRRLHDTENAVRLSITTFHHVSSSSLSLFAAVEKTNSSREANPCSSVNIPSFTEEVTWSSITASVYANRTKVF